MTFWGIIYKHAGVLCISLSICTVYICMCISVCMYSFARHKSASFNSHRVGAAACGRAGHAASAVYSSALEPLRFSPEGRKRTELETLQAQALCGYHRIHIFFISLLPHIHKTKQKQTHKMKLNTYIL